MNIDTTTWWIIAGQLLVLLSMLAARATRPFSDKSWLQTSKAGGWLTPIVVITLGFLAFYVPSILFRSLDIFGCGYFTMLGLTRSLGTDEAKSDSASEFLLFLLFIAYFVLVLLTPGLELKALDAIICLTLFSIGQGWLRGKVQAAPLPAAQTALTSTDEPSRQATPAEPAAAAATENTAGASVETTHADISTAEITASNPVVPSEPTGNSASKRQRHPGSIWIEAHCEELPLHEWVAASKDGLVAHDPDPDDLNTKVAVLGLRPDEVCLAYIDEPAPPIVRQH